MRANQKDLYYLAQLTERFEDVSRSLLGELEDLQLRRTRLTLCYRYSLAAELEQGATAWQSTRLLCLDHAAG